MPGTRHYYFQECIGQGDWFTFGTTLQDVRYAVEGYAAFDGEMAPDAVLPDEVIFHYPKCYGGDVWEGYGLFNYIRSLSARGVKTTSLIEGLCASIATLTAMAADTVLMNEAAFWMVHKPMVDAGPDANEADHLAAAGVLAKIQDQLVGRYVARSNGKLDAATAHALVNQTSWLTADECLAYGFITGKLEEAPLEAPAGAEKVLNYLPKSALKTATMPTFTAAEKKSFFAELRDELKGLFKNEEAAVQPTTPPAPPVVTNASEEVTDNDPMYYADGTTLGVDSAVYSDAEMTLAYPDGEYTLADGRAATVAAGLITVLADAATEDEAAAPATNTAPDLAAENAVLKQQLAAALAAQNLAQRQATAATNKLRQTVPGSAGNPTKPGDAQNMASIKPGTPKNTGGNMFSLTPPSTSTRK
jgi:ATP-dependent protease ClpP protease subunit